MRLLKNQETQCSNLRLKIEGYIAKCNLVTEQRILSIAAEEERHDKTLEALNNDSDRLIDLNEKAMKEAQELLANTEAQYAADFKTLDHARKAKPVTTDQPDSLQAPASKPIPPKLPMAAPVLIPPVVFAEGMQTHMQATGDVSAEILAMLPAIASMMNGLMAAAMLPAPVSVDASVTTQNEDDYEEKARLQEED